MDSCVRFGIDNPFNFGFERDYSMRHNPYERQESNVSFHQSLQKNLKSDPEQRNDSRQNENNRSHFEGGKIKNKSIIANEHKTST